MKNQKLVWQSLLHSFAVFAYVAGVAWFMFNAEAFFGGAKSFLVPVGVLLLFVMSAAIVGSLVLVRPAVMYMNGQKSQAIKFLLFVIGWLVIFTVSVFLILLTYR